MDVIPIKIIIQKIKSFLVFFYVGAILFGCGENKESITPVLEYENSKAVGVSFRLDGEVEQLGVYRLNTGTVPILGNFSQKGEFTLFTPVIPFDNGGKFGISHKGKQIATFKVETGTNDKAPEILAIYPKKDTVPLNLLKLYVVFSEPMQYVGNALDFITVFDETERIEVHPFLDIETELWNKEHSRLTLWFDPGRIKTDLIPNKEKGLPLKRDHRYRINVTKDWKSATGVPLVQSYSKTIHVTGKDVEQPDPRQWKIFPPEKNTKKPLKITFNEVLDPILALESIALFSGDTVLSGNLKLADTHDGVLFNPSNPWQAGDYHISIHPVLEDLAGNNLENLFDSDVRDSNTEKDMVSTLKFSIQ